MLCILRSNFQWPIRARNGAPCALRCSTPRFRTSARLRWFQHPPQSGAFRAQMGKRVCFAASARNFAPRLHAICHHLALRAQIPSLAQPLWRKRTVGLGAMSRFQRDRAVACTPARTRNLAHVRSDCASGALRRPRAQTRRSAHSALTLQTRVGRAAPGCSRAVWTFRAEITNPGAFRWSWRQRAVCRILRSDCTPGRVLPFQAQTRKPTHSAPT